MEKKLQKFRENLVIQRRARRNKVGLLIEVLEKSKIITDEEKKQIRKEIIENFRKEENSDVYVEVNKKFHGIRKTRREITKINNEISDKEKEINGLQEKIDDIKQIDFSRLSDEDLLNKKKELSQLINEKIKREGELKVKKDELKRNQEIKDESDKMLGIEESKEENKIVLKKVKILPVETKDITKLNIKRYPLKKNRKSWRLVGSNDTIEGENQTENIHKNSKGNINLQNYTPIEYIKKVEENLVELGEDMKIIKEALGEDNGINNKFKDELLKRLTEKYNSKKDEMESDERYVEIKQKLESLKKRLKEMNTDLHEKEKLLEGIKREIKSIKEGETKDEDTLREIELILKQRSEEKEIENIKEEIKSKEREYGGYREKTLEENKIDINQNDGEKNTKYVGGKTVEEIKIGEDIQIKWGGQVLGTFKRYVGDRDTRLYDVEGKPMFWVEDKKGNYKLVWGNEEYVAIKENKIRDMKNIGGKPCLIVENKSGVETIIRGHEKMGEGYEHVSFFKDIGGEPCFVAHKGDDKRIVIWGDERMGDCYEYLLYLRDTGGKPFFVAKNKRDKRVAIWGEEQIGEEYEEINNVQEIGGKQCFVAKNTDGTKVVIWGREQIGEEYEEINKIHEVGGKLCFLAKNTDGTKVVIRGKKQLGGEYESVDCIREVGGKPYFEAENKNGGKIAIWGNKQLGNEYVKIQVLNIGSSPCFWAKKEDGTYDLVWGNKMLKSNCERIAKLVNIGGKPRCVVKENGKWTTVWGDKDMMDVKRNLYPSLNIQNMGGKPFITADIDNNCKIVIWGSEQIGEVYEELKGTQEVGGKPFFVAKNIRGKRVAIWGEKQLGNEYEGIKKIQEIGGKPYFEGLRDDGYNDIIRGNENLKLSYNDRFCEGKYTFEIKGVIGGKPFIVITLKDSKKQIVMWGEEQQGKEYKEIDKIQEIGGKPYFQGKRDDGGNDIMRGNKLMNTGYYNKFGGPGKWNFSMEKAIGGKPFIVITLKDSKKQIVMWGEEQQGKEYKEINKIQEIGGKPYFEGLRDDGISDIMRGNELMNTGYCDKIGVNWKFSMEKAIGGKPFIVITLDDSKKQIAMWGEEQLGKEYEEIKKIQEIGGKPYFEGRDKKGERILKWGEVEIMRIDGYTSGIRSEDGKPYFEYNDDFGYAHKIRVISDSGEFIEENI